MKITKQLRISKTPQPPYYSVTTTATLNSDISGYFRLAETLLESAQQIQGFLGLEACLDKECGIAVSYWTSLEAIENWRRHGGHQQAKALAKERWFENYITRIAKVEQVY